MWVKEVYHHSRMSSCNGSFMPGVEDSLDGSKDDNGEAGSKQWVSET